MSPEARRGPVSPSEAAELQTEQIPEEVFIVFNSLIARNLREGRSTVLRDEVVTELEARGMNREDIFSKHWLDVEGSYCEAGWDVKYDSPVAYGGETFEPYYEFRAEQK
jgi:hypothetical protein